MSDGESSEKLGPRKSDDRFALLTVLVGAALALAARRDPILLAAGLTLGAGGVLFAVRGERAIEARRWLRAALVVTVVAVVARVAIDLYQEWVAGQWLAEGAAAGVTSDSLAALSRVTLFLRVTALAASAGVLLGALTNRMKK